MKVVAFVCSWAVAAIASAYEEHARVLRARADRAAMSALEVRGIFGAILTPPSDTTDNAEPGDAPEVSISYSGTPPTDD